MVSASADRDDFTKNFLISLAGHVLIAALAFLGGKLVLGVFKNNNDVEIIQSAVRVDVVGMPKFTVQELREMEKEPVLAPAEPEVAKSESPVETKPEVEDVIKKDDLVIQEEGKKKKKASFLNIISDYSAKKVAPTAAKKGSKSGASNKNLDALVIEGNRISQGSALVGDFSDGPNSPFAQYVQTLPGTIRPFWKLPSYLLDKDLRCKIRINLSPNGQLLKLEILESSGTPEFDARAERAARDAAPYPKPSEEVGLRLSTSGIILRFPL